MYDIKWIEKAVAMVLRLVEDRHPLDEAIQMSALTYSVPLEHLMEYFNRKVGSR